jgi:hypothetical protein
VVVVLLSDRDFHWWRFNGGNGNLARKHRLKFLLPKVLPILLPTKAQTTTKIGP